MIRGGPARHPRGSEPLPFYTGDAGDAGDAGHVTVIIPPEFSVVCFFCII